jgi:hypothetical protein
MEADDILLQKNWSELTDAEKAMVRELAANEQEYTQLRQFLLLAADEVTAVPPVAETVRTHVLQQITTQQAGSLRRWWYLAAAALLAGVAVTTVFLLQPTPGITTVGKNDRDTVKTDTLIPALPIARDSVREKVIPAPTQKIKAIPQAVQKPALRQPQQPPRFQPPKKSQQDLAINLSKQTVAANNDMLDLITEVY